MTNIIDETLTGAAATTFTSSTFSLTSGKVYRFRASIFNAGNNVFSIYMNGDTTDANYRRGYLTKSSVGNDSAPVTVSPNTGTGGDFYGYLCVFDSRVHMFGQIVVNNSSSTNRWLAESVYHSSETSLTSISIVSSAASGVDVGTRITIDEYPVDYSAEVTGAATTSLSLSGLSLSGAPYLFFAGVKHTNSATITDFSCNGDTTESNYRRCLRLSSGGGSESSDRIGVETASNSKGVAAGIIGVRTTSNRPAWSWITDSDTTGRCRVCSQTNASETNWSSFQLDCLTANGLDVGSFLSLTEICDNGEP